MGRLGSIVDSVVTAFSPRAGLQRRIARLQLDSVDRQAGRGRRDLSSGGFASAEKSRDAFSWLTSKLSPQSALEADRDEIFDRADSANKNFELAVAHVEGRVTRVIGSGTRLDPCIKERDGITKDQVEDWNDWLREEWERQAERLGKGNKPYWLLQQTMHRHLERHGEFFLLIGDKYDPLSPTSLKVEVIHPRRVETPPGKEADKLCRMGVQLNEDGEVIGYHIRNSHPGDTKDVDQSHEYYEATYPNGLPRVFHYYDESEAGQRRGFPRMQVGLPRLKNVEEYTEAELERNWGGALNIGVIKTNLSAEEASFGEVIDDKGRRVKDMAPGQWNYVGLADEVQFNSPTGAPNTYEVYVGSERRMFCAGAGCAYEITANDYRGLSYATARALWNVEETNCSVLHMIHVLCLAAVYRNFVTRMVTTPDSGFDVDQAIYRERPWVFWSVRMIPPSKPSLDPAREDRNELVLIEAGVKPASDFVERKNPGMVAEEVYKRVAKDRSDRRENDLEEHMPNMGRDPQPASPTSRTMPGDPNPESSEANTAGVGQ